MQAVGFMAVWNWERVDGNRANKNTTKLAVFMEIRPYLLNKHFLWSLVISIVLKKLILTKFASVLVIFMKERI